MARPKAQPTVWNNAVLDRDEQFARKRQALIHEAARVFSRSGYHDTSLEDIARNLGVTKAALYHYVSGKQEVLFECHKLSLDLGDDVLQMAHAHQGTGLEKVCLLTRRYVELMTDQSTPLSGVTAEYTALSEEQRALITARRDEFDSKFRALIREGIRDGSIRDIAPKSIVLLFMGAINWVPRWYKPNGPMTGAQLANEFTDLLARAIENR